MSRCECCDSIIEHEARYLVAHYDNAPVGMGMSRSDIIDELRDALERLDEERESTITPTLFELRDGKVVVAESKPTV
jgi:hypothetical protein